MVIGGGARALHAVVDCAAGPDMSCWAQREKVLCRMRSLCT